MARKEKAKLAAAADRLDALVAAGDHGGARAEARRLAADPGAPEGAHTRAAEVLRALAPERYAVLAGAASAAVALGLAAWLLTR